MNLTHGLIKHNLTFIVTLHSSYLFLGIFGMNLTHGLEEHNTAFFATLGGISVIMISLFTKLR